MNFQPRGISDQIIRGPGSYASEVEAAAALLKTQPTWNGVGAEAVARMRLQNRFKTGLDIARFTAAQMRADMARYDNDATKYTQSLGCWHGFIAQQKLISVKKHFGTTDRTYLYLSGWMIAALRSEFGPLPDQSMHEKTSVPALIEELYTFLRQADSRELSNTFRALDAARKALRSITSRLTSSRSSRISMRASAMPRRPICSPRR
jgi:isocitrate lyase